MAAPYVNSTPTAITPTDDIVERARTILADHGHAVPASQPGFVLGNDPIHAINTFGGLRDQARDLIAALVRLLEQLPTSAPPGRQPIAGAVPLAAGDAILPVLRLAIAEPGRIATTALGLVNDTAAPAPVALRATSLVSPSGDEIPAALVTFEPSRTTVQSKTETPVRVAVQVPETARPGTYTGLVQAIGTQATRALLNLEVK
jgi:hypothetical protein